MTPMQFAPRNTGPPSPLPWASRMRSIMRAAISLLSSVSPSPPGMSITLRAAPVSNTSSTRPGTCSAPTATMNSSSGSPTLRRSGTQRTPEGSGSPSRRMTIRPLSNPEPMMFSRMVRPKFLRLADTPMMPMRSGCSRFLMRSTGRAVGSFSGSENLHMPSSGTIR